jgi:tryptophan synthase beta chain
MMVRDFQSIIGNEMRQQMQEVEAACGFTGRLHRRRPNAMGLFHPSSTIPPWKSSVWKQRPRADISSTPRSAAVPASCGNRTYLLMDEDGQIQTHIRFRQGRIIRHRPDIPAARNRPGQLSLGD